MKYRLPAKAPLEGLVMSNARWRINSRCIDCFSSSSVAPGLISHESGQAAFVREPATAEELEAAWRAVHVCPVAAVEAPHGAVPVRGLFPHDLGAGVWRLGFNAKSSFGAHSYFAEQEGVRFMVDSPRWAAHVVSWLESHGGPAHILLTHRDDVADAERYAKHFGARVWIHEGDASSARFATDLLRGDDPPSPFSGLAVITVPGHTRGSVMFRMNETLFAGDSLSWDTDRNVLRGFRELCWFDWPTQLRSLRKLKAHAFARVLPGHGGSVTLPIDRMQSALDAMLSAG